MKWHFFLDVSGELAGLSEHMMYTSPEHYAEGSTHHWVVDTDDRDSLWKFCIAAIACGAKEAGVIKRALTWKFTQYEGMLVAQRMGVKLVRETCDGPDVWIAAFSDSKGEDEGRGPSVLHALSALAKAGALRAELKRKKVC